MDQQEIRALLEQVAQGQRSVDEAVLALKMEPFQELGFAKVDNHRGLRQGAAEVIYGAGKTPRQIHDIAASMRQTGEKAILITRMTQEAAQVVGEDLPLSYHEMGRIGIVGEMPAPTGKGTIVVATGGTSDMPVAEEAARLAKLAQANGIDGIVCSPMEAHDMRELLGPDALIVTPGVRPVGAALGDQSRVATPSQAIERGASHIVVGRPITGADDPVAAFDAIVAELVENVA